MSFERPKPVRSSNRRPETVTHARWVGFCAYMFFVWIAMTASAEGEVAAEASAEPTARVPSGKVLGTSEIKADQEAVQRFLKIWRRNKFGVAGNKWYGISTLQNPVDAWIIQEIISAVRPDYIVETGTWHGGSALLWATILENVNPSGKVITIDVEDKSAKARRHPIAERRVEFLHGSSADPKIIEHVTNRVRGRKVLVLLDSLHTRDHVAKELAAYAPLVSPGSYVIVQDTGIGEKWPLAAIRDFLVDNSEFEIDRSRERLILTNSRSGYLKRVKPAAPR